MGHLKSTVEQLECCRLEQLKNTVEQLEYCRLEQLKSTVEQLEYCRLDQLKKSTVEPLKYYSMGSLRVQWSSWNTVGWSS
jgi:hypothetical protein